MPKWNDLAPQERAEIFYRRSKGEKVSSLANELGMNENTLRGRLSEFRRGQNDLQAEINSLKVNKSGNKNSLEITATFPEDADNRVTTLEKLLQVAEVDLDVWDVERWVINTWEGYRKEGTKSLTWVGGRVDGFVEDGGGIVAKTIFQVKAWLVRKKPLAIEPALQAIEIHPAYPRLVEPENIAQAGIRRALIIPDLQVGFSRDLKTGKLVSFHDRDAMNIVLQIAQDKRFDRIVFLGDLLDLADWGDSFVRSPEMYFTTQPALIELAWWLSQIRSVQPVAEMTVIEGNHEQRMERVIIKNIASAYQLSPAFEDNPHPSLSIPRLLGLDKLNIDWVGGYPDAEVWLADDLVCVHGDRAKSVPGTTARAMNDDREASVIFGHIHRKESVVRSVIGRGSRRVVSATCPGCLCRVDGVVPGSTPRQNWSQGFAVASYGDDISSVVDVVSIDGGTALYEGKLYRAAFDLDHLERDANWGF